MNTLKICKRWPDCIFEIAQKEKEEKINWGLVPGKKEETHIALSLPLNATVKPRESVWSSNVRTRKVNNSRWVSEEEQNSKYHWTMVCLLFFRFCFCFCFIFLPVSWGFDLTHATTYKWASVWTGNLKSSTLVLAWGAGKGSLNTQREWRILSSVFLSAIV